MATLSTSQSGFALNAEVVGGLLLAAAFGAGAFSLDGRNRTRA